MKQATAQIPALEYKSRLGVIAGGNHRAVQGASDSFPAIRLRDIRSNTRCQRKGSPESSFITSEFIVSMQASEVTFIPDIGRENAYSMALSRDVVCRSVRSLRFLFLSQPILGADVLR